MAFLFSFEFKEIINFVLRRVVRHAPIVFLLLLPLLAFSIEMKPEPPQTAALEAAETGRFVAPSPTPFLTFGQQMQLDGETIIVSAPGKQNGPDHVSGAVYVYKKGLFSWEPFQEIICPDGGDGGSFGSSIDVFGDWLFVGAPEKDFVFDRQGAIYVYRRNGEIWSHYQTLLPNDQYGTQRFGSEVSVHSDIAVIGAMSVGDIRGSVYVFELINNGWTQNIKLASTNTFNDKFGDAGLEAGEDIVFVGATWENFAPDAPEVGAVVVYEKVDGAWVQTSKIFAAQKYIGARFGSMIHYEGSKLFVGAPKDLNPVPSTHQGGIHIFSKTNGNWTEEQKLAAFGPGDARDFGVSIDVDGSALIVGSINSRFPNSPIAGAAYIFDRVGDSYVNREILRPSTGGLFGTAVVAQGKDFLISSPENSPDNILRAGAVFTFSNGISAPDLVANDDTGISNSDNLTNLRGVHFNLSAVTNGATVELYRGASLIDSQVATGDSIVLRDANIPADGQFTYRARQIVNDVADSMGPSFTMSVDTAGPVITLTQAPGQADPASEQSNCCNFSLSYNEAIYGFDAREFSLAGSTADISNAFITVHDEIYPNQIDVDNIISNGQILQLGLPAGVVSDAAGNLNSQSAGADTQITVDNVRPSVTIEQAPGQNDPSSVLPLRFIARFSEPITGFTSSDISFTGSTANLSGRVVTITAAGADYLIEVSNINSNGQVVRVSVPAGSVQDWIGQSNFNSTSTDDTVTLDNVRPSVTVNKAPGQVEPTSEQPVRFQVVFNEPVIGFEASDVSLQNSTADVSNAQVVVTGSGPTYTVAVSGIRVTGQVVATIPANVATDPLGNPNFNSMSSDNDIFVSVPSRSVPFDFDGDRKSDYSVWRPSNGTWFLGLSQSGTMYVQPWGAVGDKIVPADFDNDRVTDMAVYRPGEGKWFVINSNGATLNTVQFGLNGDIPLPQDFDGDGSADFGIWRPSNGTWYLGLTQSGSMYVLPFGLSTDKPVPADYDGDGKSELAIWRPSEGRWYVANIATGAFGTFDWGLNGDMPIVGDFSGDGKSDYTVYRPSNQTWYRIHTDDLQVKERQWGIANDIPAPGDFDGDGKLDLAVFRPSEGKWYVLTATSAQLTQTFGLNGDTPTESAFVY